MEKKGKYQGWSLFLDRDGVINRRTPGDYLRNWEGFEFLPGVPDSIAFFNSIFQRIVVLTNQQGIGKGLMHEEDLKAIHQEMLREIRQFGGDLDGIYFCPHLKTLQCTCRKPGIGMAIQAKDDFPEILFEESVMIGDSLSDIQFGCRLGMHTVLIEGKEEDQAAIEKALLEEEDFYITYRFKSLERFAQWLSIL